jgi:hypothetical protein
MKLRPKGMTAKPSTAGTKAMTGASQNSIGLASAGTRSSLRKNLMPSATSWGSPSSRQRPNSSARLGPMRSWIMALPRRSAQVSSAARVSGPRKTISTLTIIQKVSGIRCSRLAKDSMGGFPSRFPRETRPFKLAGRPPLTNC